MLVGDKSVCVQCHNAGSAGGKAAVEMAASINGLSAALKNSDQVLRRAASSGMEVSEAMLRQQEAQATLVKARVAVHAFRVAAVGQLAQAGLAAAAETRRAGEDALKERDYRRMGLAVALLAILATIAGLWLALRAIERTPQAPAEAGRR
jgi:hypothetical protein